METPSPLNPLLIIPLASHFIHSNKTGILLRLYYKSLPFKGGNTIYNGEQSQCARLCTVDSKKCKTVSGVQCLANKVSEIPCLTHSGKIANMWNSHLASQAFQNFFSCVCCLYGITVQNNPSLLAAVSFSKSSQLKEAKRTVFGKTLLMCISSNVHQDISRRK